MNSVWRLIFLSLPLVCFWLCRTTQGFLCHREEQFVKVEGSLQPMNSIRTTSVAGRAFCSTLCVDFPGCNSFAYLTSTVIDNCRLSASIDGESTTAASVYKKVPVMFAVSAEEDTLDALVHGCSGSPCQNGVTCVDTCVEPYYMCPCPSDKQGVNCEWDLACNVEDWEISFDVAGTVQCSGTKSYMTGFERNEAVGLHGLKAARCCPVPIEYSQEHETCTKGDWWLTFGTETWNSCPDGYFVSGFKRGDGNNLGSLEEGVCCKPPSAPDHWGACYIEDITASFDEAWAKVGCQKQLYYIVAIETHECDPITCMEKLKCCRVALE